MKYDFNTYNLPAGSGPLGLGQLSGGGGPSDPAFIFEVITDNAGTSDDDQFTLPLRAAGNYDFNVDWGDGNDDDISAYDDAAATHTFTGGAGTYTITMTGTMKGFRFAASGDRLKFIDIQNWGDFNLGDEDFNFWLCTNLIVTATDSPSVGTTLNQCFLDCDSLVSVGAAWDLTGCTTMLSMFTNCPLFNDPNIGDWNVSSISGVNGMNGVFSECDVFNQDISGWDTSNAVDMARLFRNCPAFNQPVNSLDTSSCTDMNGMFQGATIFNQPVSNFDTSQVTTFGNMFRDTDAFNQSLATDGVKWDVSACSQIGGMFNNAKAFNQSLTSWDVSNIFNFGSAFRDATAFNQSIDSWTFLQTGNVSFNNLFNGATAYNQAMNSWDLTGVNSFQDMFLNATSFNGDISTWDFSVADTTVITGMLDGATDFDQDIGGWDISTITAMTNLLRGSTMSTSNYDATLIGWSNGDQLSAVTFHGGNATYTNGGAAKTAHDNLDITRGWTITDGGPA